MAEQKPKGGKRLVNRAKRHLQNIRTFLSVQKRRAKHAKAHGIPVSAIFAKRWTEPPTSKASGKTI